MFPEPYSEEFWLWVQNGGLREYPALFAPLLPPLPPPILRARVSGVEDAAAYLNVGALTYQAVHALLGSAGLDLGRCGRLLDFGCGAARTLRYLYPYAGQVELWGCDVDVEAIEWNRNSFGAASFLANERRPPTAFPDGYFGMILAISVFSHFDDSDQTAWMNEVARICAPGGYVCFSFHGERAWTKVRTDPALLASIVLSPDEVAAAEGSWKERQYVFLRHILPSVFVDPKSFGFALMSGAHVRDRWGGFEVVGHHEAAISDWQDLILLRRRA